ANRQFVERQNGAALPVQRLPVGELEQAFTVRADRKLRPPGVVDALVEQQHDIGQRMVGFVDTVEMKRRSRAELMEFARGKDVAEIASRHFLADQRDLLLTARSQPALVGPYEARGE